MTSKMLPAIVLTIAAATGAAAQPPARPQDFSRSVTLSLAEYNRLMDLANRPPGAAAPPVAAALSDADIRVRVEGDVVRGTYTLTGDVLRPGYARVGLMSGATLVNATAGGRPVPLVADGASHAALVQGPAPFSLVLEWGGPLAFGPGRASFALPVPSSGAARATIDLPGEQADVRVTPGLVTGRAAANGRTLVEVTLDPGRPAEVSWSMRDSAPVAAARELRTLADVRTLVSLSDSDVRIVALIDMTVITGELRTVTLGLPAGYELTGITGSTVDTSDTRGDTVTLTLRDPAARSHQFLVSLERSHAGGSFSFETGLVAVRDVQRERGEVAIEGTGTLELTAADRDGLHRIDIRELHPSLPSLARQPILSAFRYQRTTAPPPTLALEVKRFDDAGVLAAVAEYAEATTMVTSEGRALTEVKLHLKNRAQPFMKVTLPPGATMVSVEVGAETAKPVLGADGIRVPLMRPGFRPQGSYIVSYVYLHAGVPFAKKGDLDMALPRMDVPIGRVWWEIFVPERYAARVIGGNAIDQHMVWQAEEQQGRRRAGMAANAPVPASVPPVAAPAPMRAGSFRVELRGGEAGVIRGRVTDLQGAVLPGVSIEVATSGARKSAISDAEGRFSVAGVPTGQVTVAAALAGFNTQRSAFGYDAASSADLNLVMDVATLSETVTVSASSPAVAVAGQIDRVQAPPSENVINLQRRTAGVLPIRVDVPRTGTSHQFAKPLVIDQETTVRMRYKRR